MNEDEFEAKLGRVGADRRFANDLRRALNRAGGAHSRSTGTARFHGSRIGRGAGVGRVLGSSDRFAGSRARRVVVKARFVRLSGNGADAARAHLRYLQRDGTTRAGERGPLYSADHDAVDGRTFLERGAGDRHQFSFIVAPEDGAEYADLKPLVRRWMAQVEADLGTRLEWVAVDHFNTGHPHSHVLVRGVDDRGKDLIIAREYISRGLASRAAELVNLDLGPRSDREILDARRREVRQERFTGLDRRLLRARDADGLVSASHRDGSEQAFRAGRLATLARMGLAREAGGGRFRLADDLEDRLRTIGRRGDIIATMHAQLKQRAPHVPPQDYAIYDPQDGTSLVGRVAARGLADEHRDRHYLIVAATDGRSHYVELGSRSAAEPLHGAEIVRVTPSTPSVRDVDRTIAAVAGGNDGVYSIEHHLRYDEAASRQFAEAHIRRLEAIRRHQAGVERRADGSWLIAPDHLARVLAFERAAAAARPVRIESLSDQPLDMLARHDGATWLDEQIVATRPERLERGFGAEVRLALASRRQWLIEQGLAWREGDAMRVRPDLLARLRERELARVGAQLAPELGLGYVPHAGDRIEGICRGSVRIGTARYAIVEASKEFTLVPWRPVLDQQVGRFVSGIERGGSITWRFGRERGGPEIGGF